MVLKIAFAGVPVVAGFVKFTDLGK